MSGQAPSSPTLDLNSVQGDILIGGLPKKSEIFFFFQMNEDKVQDFRKQLAQLVPLITSSAQVKKDREQIDKNKTAPQDPKSPPPLLKLSGVNLSFTQKGLTLMGIKDDIGDSAFKAGMLAGAQALGDGITSSSGQFDSKWNAPFKQDIHGVILITGHDDATTAAKLQQVQKIFSIGTPTAMIREVGTSVGRVRDKDPKGQDVKGHEHFGFLDGISEPAVQGVDLKTNRGQETIRQGIVLLGREGDSVSRPSWALDGSFLSFRYLSQLVPEFDAFLTANAIKSPNMSQEQGSELLGARLVGRWKSGAPVDVTPTVDDPALGADPTRNNDFSYNNVFPDDQSTQDRCPFAAHVRKTNPRADLAKFRGTELKRIIRSGIPFGPEVTPSEAKEGKTSLDRGLLFVAYQSNISNGFQFIQESWANNPGFPISKPVAPGFDPIIGQSPDPKLFRMSGADPNNQSKSLNIGRQWVVSNGAEYFFSPSIPALRDTFAIKAQ